MPGPQRVKEKAGGSGRNGQHVGVRPGQQAAHLPGAQRQLGRLEHRDGGHARIQRQQHAVHQDGHLPPTHAEAPGLRCWVQGFQDLLSALRVHADYRRAAVGLHVQVPRPQRLPHRLQSRLPRRHRERLEGPRHQLPLQLPIRSRQEGVHSDSRRAVSGPADAAAGELRQEEAAHAGGGKHDPRTSARHSGAVQRGGGAVPQVGSAQAGRRHVHRPAQVGRGQAVGCHHRERRSHTEGGAPAPYCSSSSSIAAENRGEGEGEGWCPRTTRPWCGVGSGPCTECVGV
mmetsp:Transcript_50764/g.127350  ORF Transcript_50764/g.127350 Transcript_50764/m.127350 type:complete len:286 (-) Transcript_50764:4531-5388(-)